MKFKFIMMLIVGGTFLCSCDDDAAENAETEMNDQMNQVADSLEQVDAELDRTKQEIEAASQEVDDLLNEL